MAGTLTQGGARGDGGPGGTAVPVLQSSLALGCRLTPRCGFLTNKGPPAAPQCPIFTAPIGGGIGARNIL